MSDSVDRVFVHALATVRRLPRTGSSRPPPSARLQLYGLYKQSMEGDVSAILPRPTLPTPSPDPADPINPNGGSLRRYASRDSRTREAQAEIEKWDAWNACAGMSRTEAKRRYITTLIETMKEYASGTVESRELVSELEFVWNQIRSQSGSDESEEGESPTRKLERAGMKRTHLPQRRTSSERGDDDDGGGGGGGGNGDSGNGISTSIFTRLSSSSNSNQNNNTNRGTSEPPTKDSKQKSVRNENQGLRVLSPTSIHSSDGIVANEEHPIPIPNSESENEEDDDDDDDEYASASEDKPDAARPTRKSKPSTSQPNTNTTNNGPSNLNDPPRTSNTTWRRQVESHLRHLTTELAALREQLSSHHLLTRSSFSTPTNLPLHKRMLHKSIQYTHWLARTATRQLLIQLGLLTAVLIWGRIRGDRRVEVWCRDRAAEVWTWLTYFLSIFVRRSTRRRKRVGNLKVSLAE